MNTNTTDEPTETESYQDCPRCNGGEAYRGLYCEQCGWVDCTGIETGLREVADSHPAFEDVDVLQDSSDGVTFEASWQGARWTFIITHDPIVHDYQIHARHEDGAGMWTPGSVDDKADAIAFVLDEIGLAEDCGDVQPSDVY